MTPPYEHARLFVSRVYYSRAYSCFYVLMVLLNVGLLAALAAITTVPVRVSELADGVTDSAAQSDTTTASLSMGRGGARRTVLAEVGGGP